MNGLSKFFPKKQREILQNPNSNEAKSFFEGMRLAIDIINDADPEEQKKVLSTTNRLHLIACMSRFADKQGQSQYDDDLELLKIYDINKAELEAFLFNVARIDTTTGQALDADGSPIEDENFQLLDGKTARYWPYYEISDFGGTSKAFSCEEYYALSPEERAKYRYVRHFYLEMNGVQTLKVPSNDHVMIKALIHNLLKIDGDVEWLRERLWQTYGWEYIPLRDTNGNLVDERKIPEMLRRGSERIDQMLQRNICRNPPTNDSRLDALARRIAEKSNDPWLAPSESGRGLLHQLMTIHIMDVDNHWRWAITRIDIDAFCGIIETYNYNNNVFISSDIPVAQELYRALELERWFTLGDLLEFAGMSNKHSTVAAIPDCDTDHCYHYFDSIVQDVCTKLGKILMHFNHAILDNGTAAPLTETEKSAAKKLANALIKAGFIHKDSVFPILA